jgi:hypothetical protein
MDASRLEIEFAFKYGASERPQAWSKYTEGTSAHRRAVNTATGANNVPVGQTGKEGVNHRNGRKPEEGKYISCCRVSQTLLFLYFCHDEVSQY